MWRPRSAGRRTNLALLGVLGLALLTGFVAFAVGTRWNRWISVAHGVTGLALLAMTPWKSLIVRRGLRRTRPGVGASLLLVAVVAVAIAAGIVHATGLLVSAGPVTAMQVHVGAALLAIPLGAWHVAARRVTPRRTDLSRRNLLRAGLLLGGSGLAYAAVEGAVRAAGLPGADRRFTGSYEAGSLRPDAMPVTQWLDDDVQRVDASAWRLVVAGPGGAREWTYGELAAFDDRVRAVLDCTGGWYAEQDWEGVRLDLLVRATEEVRSVSVRSATGYARRLPVQDLPNLLLATRLGGAPLSAGHGFPARLVAPGRRGFWWVKWVERIEVSPVPWWVQSPFPLT